MFKKRQQNKKRTFKQSGITEDDLKNSGDNSDKELAVKPKAPLFKQRKFGERVNTTSTQVQADEAKEFREKEVQDLTNNFKSSQASKKLAEENLALKDKYLAIDSDKDGLYYAKQNMLISQAIKDGQIDPKTYRGMNAYANYHQLTEEQIKRKALSGTLKGPLTAPTYAKSITRIDHNPERCKDYYEHGYCGYGDTCVFIHDRSDYKSGNQLEQEYQAELKKKQRRLQDRDAGCCDASDAESNYEIHSAEGEQGGFPECCAICEGEFQEPVVTKCKHYFCDHCAIRNYATDGNCFVCRQDTQGTFNAAFDLVKHLKQLKQGPAEYAEDSGNAGSEAGNEEEVLKEFAEQERIKKERK